MLYTLDSFGAAGIRFVIAVNCANCGEDLDGNPRAWMET